MDRALSNQSYLLFGQGLARSAPTEALPVFTLFTLHRLVRQAGPVLAAARLYLKPIQFSQEDGSWRNWYFSDWVSWAAPWLAG